MEFNLNNIVSVKELTSELELESATALYHQARLLIKDGAPLFTSVKTHIKSIIKDYEDKHWSEENITDQKILESDDVKERMKMAKEAFNQMKELLDARDYHRAASLMDFYCDMDDVTYGELKMILVITKSFKNHSILEHSRKRVLDLTESKYGKQI